MRGYKLAKPADPSRNTEPSSNSRSVAKDDMIIQTIGNSVIPAYPASRDSGSDPLGLQARHLLPPTGARSE